MTSVVLLSTVVLLWASVPPASAVERDCVPTNNFDETAQTFISRCLKGSVASEFPGEFLNRPIGEFYNGSSAAAHKAKKLLTQQYYRKNYNGATISPATQHVLCEFTTSAYWDVTEYRDPDDDMVLRFDYGDGTSSDFIVPRGTGTVTFSVSHYYALGGGPFTTGGQCAESFFTATATIQGTIVGGAALPAALPAFAQVAFC